MDLLVLALGRLIKQADQRVGLDTSTAVDFAAAPLAVDDELGELHQCLTPDGKATLHFFCVHRRPISEVQSIVSL